MSSLVTKKNSGVAAPISFDHSNFPRLFNWPLFSKIFRRSKSNVSDTSRAFKRLAEASWTDYVQKKKWKKLSYVGAKFCLCRLKVDLDNEASFTSWQQILVLTILKMRILQSNM